MVSGVVFTSEYALTATVLVAVAGGVCLGTLSGLTPGLHVNTLAVAAAATLPEMGLSRLVVGVVLLAAATTHSILDVVPALAVGVPDAAMAASTLPGHRLVLGGRGREAIRVSALGSASAVPLAFLLAWPMTRVMTALGPWVTAHRAALLVAVTCLLLAGEPTRTRRLVGLASTLLAGGLGVLALHGPLTTPNVLLPVFAGLFGVPILLAARHGGGPPPQDDARIDAAPRRLGVSAGVGVLAGGVVSYVAGISTGVAAVGALSALPDMDDRAYVATTSAVNTATALFALFALAATGDAHTGVLVAMTDAGVPIDLPVLLTACVLAAATAIPLLLALGDRALTAAARVDHRTLLATALTAIIALTAALCGPAGLLVLAAATLVGLLPQRLGARRIHLMSVLLIPLAL